jgi:hypothetical protein
MEEFYQKCIPSWFACDFVCPSLPEGWVLAVKCMRKLRMWMKGEVVKKGKVLNKGKVLKKVNNREGRW